MNKKVDELIEKDFDGRSDVLDLVTMWLINMRI